MEAMLRSMGGRLNQPEPVIKKAISLRRMLDTKQTGLGLSVSFESALCLHLAAESQGSSIQLKLVSQAAGAKSKPHYLDKLQNVRTLLGLNQTLTLQEIGVQLGTPSLLSEATNILGLYEKHLLESYGEDRAKSINLTKELYLCAAYHAAGKRTDTKLDSTKLVELAKAKKKELVELGDEMLALLPAKKKAAANSKARKSASESILAAVQEEEAEESRKRRAADLKAEGEEEDFQVWKQRILQKAVDAGFTKYKQYLTTTSA